MPRMGTGNHHRRVAQCTPERICIAEISEQRLARQAGRLPTRQATHHGNDQKAFRNQRFVKGSPTPPRSPHDMHPPTLVPVKPMWYHNTTHENP